MKKQKLQLIVLLILCLLCVGAFFGLKAFGPEEEESAADEVTVTDFVSEDVQFLSAEGANSLHFGREGGSWYNVDDRNMNIDGSSVDSLVTSINRLTTDSYIDQPENLSDYGLDSPQLTVTVTLTDGTKKVLTVGNQNDVNSKYYIKVSDSDRVYMISSYAVTAFDNDISQFIAAETETETTETETAQTGASDTAEAVTETVSVQENETAQGTETVADTSGNVESVKAK